MSEQVTKTKNEGRVAAGKKLAEWNRKKKEDLIKNKNQVSSSGESSADEVSSKSQTALASTFLSSSFYGIGAAIALAVGIAMVFLWKHNTPNTTSQPAAEPKNDIFRMN